MQNLSKYLNVKFNFLRVECDYLNVGFNYLSVENDYLNVESNYLNVEFDYFDAGTDFGKNEIEKPSVFLISAFKNP